MTGSVLVPANGPWDLAATQTSLQTHAIAGLDLHDPARMRHTRVLRIDGVPQVVTVQLTPDGVSLTGVSAARAEQVAHQWFDLGTDIAVIDAHLGASAALASQVRQRPGIRLTRYVDVFEAVASIVLGQQVTLAAGRIFVGRLVQAFGAPVDGDLVAFPTAEVVAAAEFAVLRDALGITRARAATVHAVARLFADGYQLRFGDTSDAALSELAALRGIGPWTLTTLRIRALGEADALPTSDAVLRRSLAACGLEVTSPELADWSPYRSYATMRLWNL